MAFAAEIAALVEDLVDAITGTKQTTDTKAFSKAHTVAIKSLKSRTHIRTNPFEVDRQLGGLEERFRVHSRDALADALSDRLETLRLRPTSWHPEMLALLLELSDQPTQKTKLRDVEALGVFQAEADEGLRWEDIAREDGWDEDEALWRTIRYDGSSDEGDVVEEELSDEVSSDDGVDHAARQAEDYIIHPEDTALWKSLRETQQWRHVSASGVSEIQALREVLFLLRGLDTSLFGKDTNYYIDGVAWETSQSLLDDFATSGKQLRILRDFVDQASASPYIQIFQDSISTQLEGLDKDLSAIEERLVAPSVSTVVSLISVKTELEPRLQPLCLLSRIVERCTSGDNLFRHLEDLFLEATTAQLAGRVQIYEFLARIFVACFNIYLRPVRLWVEEGRLLPGDETFFVTEAKHPVPLSSTWRDRFSLRRNAEGALHAPNFLHPAAETIFKAGKNIVLLRLFGMYDKPMSTHQPLDYDTMCPPGIDLAPWPDLFNAAFGRWVESRYKPTSTLLKNALMEKYDLMGYIDALQALYFMSDGAAASSLCENLFEKMSSNGRWNDRHALTAVAQEIYTHVVDADRLTIRIEPGPSSTSTVRDALTRVNIDYRLPWQIATILPQSTLSHHKAIFTLLLQLRRATHALHTFGLLKSTTPDAALFSLRSQLLWFTSTLHSHLATLVLQPNALLLRTGLPDADDVDGMVTLCASTSKQILDEACLGEKLSPIRFAILDVLDLAIAMPTTKHTPTMKTELDCHIRFITNGLRSVSRATGGPASAKWDMLADMLTP